MTVPQPDLTAAIRAIQSGDVDTGKRILAQVLQRDPTNEVAWLWMSGTVTDLQQRRYCLEQILRINPDNAVARAGLAKLDATTGGETTPAATGGETTPAPTPPVTSTAGSGPAPHAQSTEQLAAEERGEAIQPDVHTEPALGDEAYATPEMNLEPAPGSDFAAGLEESPSTTPPFTFDDSADTGDALMDFQFSLDDNSATQTGNEDLWPLATDQASEGQLASGDRLDSDARLGSVFTEPAEEEEDSGPYPWEQPDRGSLYAEETESESPGYGYTSPATTGGLPDYGSLLQESAPISRSAAAGLRYWIDRMVVILDSEALTVANPGKKELANLRNHLQAGDAPVGLLGSGAQVILLDEIIGVESDLGSAEIDVDFQRGGKARTVTLELGSEHDRAEAFRALEAVLVPRFKRTLQRSPRLDALLLPLLLIIVVAMLTYGFYVLATGGSLGIPAAFEAPLATLLVPIGGTLVLALGGVLLLLCLVWLIATALKPRVVARLVEPGR